jgi:hypothetical protein
MVKKTLNHWPKAWEEAYLSEVLVAGKSFITLTPEGDDIGDD